MKLRVKNWRSLLALAAGGYLIGFVSLWFLGWWGAIPMVLGAALLGWVWPWQTWGPKEPMEFPPIDVRTPSEWTFEDTKFREKGE